MEFLRIPLAVASLFATSVCHAANVSREDEPASASITCDAFISDMDRLSSSFSFPRLEIAEPLQSGGSFSVSSIENLPNMDTGISCFDDGRLHGIGITLYEISPSDISKWMSVSRAALLSIEETLGERGSEEVVRSLLSDAKSSGGTSKEVSIGEHYATISIMPRMMRFAIERPMEWPDVIAVFDTEGGFSASDFKSAPADTDDIKGTSLQDHDVHLICSPTPHSGVFLRVDGEVYALNGTARGRAKSGTLLMVIDGQPKQVLDFFDPRNPAASDPKVNLIPEAKAMCE